MLFMSVFNSSSASSCDSPVMDYKYISPHTPFYCCFFVRYSPPPQTGSVKWTRFIFISWTTKAALKIAAMPFCHPPLRKEGRWTRRPPPTSRLPGLHECDLLLRDVTRCLVSSLDPNIRFSKPSGTRGRWLSRCSSLSVKRGRQTMLGVSMAD